MHASDLERTRIEHQLEALREWFRFAVEQVLKNGACKLLIIKGEKVASEKLQIDKRLYKHTVMIFEVLYFS